MTETPSPLRPGRTAGPPDSTIGGRDLTRWQSRGGRWLTGAASRVGHGLAPVARWSAANIAFVAFVVVAMALMAGLVYGAHEVYEAVVGDTGVAGLDQPVLDRVVALRTPGLDQAVTVFTTIGGPVGMPVLALVAVVVLAVTARRWTAVILVLVAAAGSLLMTIAGKDLIGRARPPAALAVPPLESSPSFPSGHTLNATVLTTVVVYLVLLRTSAAWQRVVTVVLGILFIAGMGLSRVYLGHHWLTDVIAGWALGLAWALAVVTAHRIHLTLSPHHPQGRAAQRPTDGDEVGATAPTAG
ncbi:MAG: phosphatase PAP2 family protein [Terracoccus sp.]